MFAFPVKTGLKESGHALVEKAMIICIHNTRKCQVDQLTKLQEHYTRNREIDTQIDRSFEEAQERTKL